MSFTPTNDLERLLVAAAGDPAARPAFLRGVLEHDLFVLAHNGELGLGTSDYEGRPHVPVFTAAERVVDLDVQDARVVPMNGRDALAKLRGRDLLLNPNCDYGKVFTVDEIESLLDGSAFTGEMRNRDVGGKQVLLGQPKNYPHRLTEALSRYFATIPAIQAGYLAHASVGGEPAHTFIGIDTKGDWRQLMQDIGVVLREVTQPGELVDLVPCHGRTNDPISQYMKRETTPFYKAARKKWFGLF